jgi:hypothetical protein
MAIHSASGNSTWQDFPSAATPITAATLESIENALDSAPKASVPICEARLTTGYTALPGNTWLGMRGQMSATVDPYSMFTNSAPGTNLITMAAPVGWPGRYHVFWQFAHDSTVGTSTVIGIIMLNCPPATVNGTGLATGYTEFRSQSTSYHPACIGEVVLAEGGTVSFAAHVAQAGTWNMQVASSTVFVKTRAILRYVGPS